MPTLHEMMAARRALSGYVYETPIIESNAMRAITGHEHVIFKCENLQRTGSFHYRGMLHKVQRTKSEDLGVNNFITFSTGNSGPALACAADQFQSTARVVLPNDASDTLRKTITHYKGTFVTCAPTLEARRAVSNQLMTEYNRSDRSSGHNQAVLVPPYVDETVLTGYGTLGVELMLQTDCRLDCVVCPVGGGSLLSSVAIAVKGMKPNVSVIAAEPTVMAHRYTSFKRGEQESAKQPVDKRSGRRTKMSDELKTALSERVSAYVDRYVDGVVHVTDEQINHALYYVYQRCKLVIDVNSAVAVAAVLACPPELQKFRRVGIILSGGNVDLREIAKLTANSKL